MAIRTFLDSGVLISAVRGDSKSHVAAREVIDDPTRVFLLSDLVQLEVLPKAVYNQQVHEVEFYEAVFEVAVEVANTSREAIARALDLAKAYGLGGFDACLAESAIGLMADEFVTTEKPTKPFFRIISEKTRFVSISATA